MFDFEKFQEDLKAANLKDMDAMVKWLKGYKPSPLTVVQLETAIAAETTSGFKSGFFRGHGFMNSTE